MLKKTLLFITAALAAQGLYAEALSPQQALERVTSTPEGRKMVKAGSTPTLAYTARDVKGEAAVYVFNQGAGKGAIFLSADDIAMPMLGYTDEGAFDPNNIPPVVEYWLGTYAEQIENAKATGTQARMETRDAYPSSWNTVAPLLATQWNQSAPYNNDTPLQGNTHTPTGCVATAMAQIMKYWNFPEIGQGKNSYTWRNPATGINQTLEMYFDRSEFLWDKMLNRYVSGQYTDDQANAVAYLMKACGYSCNMQYQVGGSGTATSLAGIAMVKNFKYDEDIQRAIRIAYTDTEWATLVYNELKANRPVLYDGYSPQGGHAFVVDGYAGNGFFHLNWGWGGTSNGYYLLTALNPSTQGAGGSLGGFNTLQGILYNIKPGNGSETVTFPGELTLFGSVNATMSGNVINFYISDWERNDDGSDGAGYGNLSLGDVRFYYGMMIQNADGSGTPTYQRCNAKINGQTNTVAIGVGSGAMIPNSLCKPEGRIPTNLADGKYKVTLVYQIASKDSYQNFIVPIGNMDYVYVTKSGNSFSVENVAPLKLKIESAQILTPLYYGYPAQVRYKITNPNDMELTQQIMPRLYMNGTSNYTGDTYLITVPAKTTITQDINTTFYKEANGKVPSTTSPLEFTLDVYDYNMDYDYGQFGTYSMRRAGSNLKVAMTELEIGNATEPDFSGNVPFFGINNFWGMEVTAGLEVSGVNTFLATPLIAVITEKGSSEPELEKEFEKYVYLESGQSGTSTTWIDFEEFDSSKIYSLSVYYLSSISSSDRKLLGTIDFGADSGVDTIINDNGTLTLTFDGYNIVADSESGVASLTVYSVAGMKVAGDMGNSQQAVVPMSELSNGIYIVKAVDNKGNEQTIKVRK